MAEGSANGSNGGTHTTIDTLSDLDRVPNEEYTKTFCNNLNTVYSCPKNVILAKLNSHTSMETLKELRQHLLTEASKIFSDFANKTPIARNSKKYICEDIFHLGFCITQNAISNDLNTVYRSENDPRDQDLSPEIEAGSDTLKLIVQMRKDYQASEAKHAKEIADLKAEIQRVSTHCKRNHSNSNRQDHIPDDQATNPSEAEELNVPAANQEPNGLITQEPNGLTTGGPTQPLPPSSSDNTNQENSQPHDRVCLPIKAAPKITDIFIGGIDPENSCADIQAHMNNGTNLGIELRDIEDITSEGRKNKAFKVSVPRSKVNIATSIWPSEVKAERYVRPPTKALPTRQVNNHTPGRNNGHHRNNRANSNNNGNNSNNNFNRNNYNNNRNNYSNNRNNYSNNRNNNNNNNRRNRNNNNNRNSNNNRNNNNSNNNNNYNNNNNNNNDHFNGNNNSNNRNNGNRTNGNSWNQRDNMQQAFREFWNQYSLPGRFN